jgi:general stress protein YciG
MLLEITGTEMANESQSGGQRGGSGNFANDREKASEAGKKGGERSHGSGSRNESGGSGGSGNFANDPERASEAGKKGGEHSHGGR